MLDLNKFANRLLNSDLPEVIRAIDLYQLQVGVFLQKKTLRDHARKYCAMMLMDHIEERDGIQKGDLARVASLSEYRELFNEIMRERGWIGLCRLRGPHSFEIKLQQGIQNCKVLADAVDLVCRYSQNGGQHLSLALAEQLSRGRFKADEPTGREPVNSVARTTEEVVLIYLLRTRCSELLPPALRQDRFAEHLLPQVRDIATLRKLFSAYNCVLRLLLPAAQQFERRPLMLQGDEVETSIQWKPLDVETKKLIDRYAKAGLQPLR
jgi:hypothetical protein